MVEQYKCNSGLISLINDICESYDLTEEEFIQSNLDFYKSYIVSYEKGVPLSITKYCDIKYELKSLSTPEINKYLSSIEKDLSVDTLHLIGIIIDSSPPVIYIKFLKMFFSAYYPKYANILSISLCETIRERYLQH